MPTYPRYDPSLDNQIRDQLRGTSYKQPTQEEDVARYVPELKKIFEGGPLYGTPPEPSLVFDNVYLGTTSNAENISLLKRLDIKYILNCAGIPVIRYERETRYKPEHGIEGYEEIPAEDGEFYDIARYFMRAHRFIDTSRIRGRVLIYCPDINRSGVIALSYIISKGVSLMKAAKEVKSKRKMALFNKGFMKQLVIFARDHGVLENCKTFLHAKHMTGLIRCRDRNQESHLLSFI